MYLDQLAGGEVGAVHKPSESGKHTKVRIETGVKCPG